MYEIIVARNPKAGNDSFKINGRLHLNSVGTYALFKEMEELVVNKAFLQSSQEKL